jgi:outer membrane lipopolysaccharide assembly protein LptE/RlpB
MKYFVPAALVLTLTLATGCGLFHKKEKKTVIPELPPAAAIQADYRDRWVERRVHELLTAGTTKTEDEARAMAATEFAKQYPLMNPPATRTGR